MSNPEAPAVTGTILELCASELGPEHIGRPIRFHADGALVHGALSYVDTEWGARVLVELKDSGDRYSLDPEAEVVIITETAAEATQRLGKLHVVEEGN